MVSIRRLAAARGAASAGRRLLAGLVLATALAVFGLPPRLARAADAFPVILTDIAGRSVTVSAEPRRIVLGEGLQFLALSLLHERPADVLTLWGDDLKTYDVSTYEVLAKAYPRLADVPTIGTRSGTLSLETILSAESDLVVLSLWQKSATVALVGQMERAGIPVVFIDFYEAPLQNTQASMLALGAAIGRSQKARAFVELDRERLSEVEAALAIAAPGRAKTFLHAFAGVWPCCWSAGSGGLGAFLALAGADNPGAQRFPSPGGGNVNVEFLLAEDPKVYIATGLSDPKVRGGLVIGAGVDAARARDSLASVITAPGLSQIAAVREGRVHGIWNYLNGSPLNILAIEAFAAWAHPEIAGRVDPARTLDRLNRDFFAAPFTGTFWVSLAGAPG